ncbi:MAG: GDSL-type esterase/lipase family protein [Verrucomicrobiales bacterium]|nr:GDSL-type esterase/lipase family protein [Verrucomicrobiales bacterium]
MKKRLFLGLFFGVVGLAAGGDFSIPETDAGLPGEGTIRRYGWFKGLWEKKRSGWAERVEADRGAVVFFGDSITQGWGDDFKGEFDGLKVANRGISGDTTRGMLLRLEDDVLALKPRAVVMLMGTNDLEEGDAAEVTAGNVELILEGLKAHDAAMPIVLCKVMPSSASKKRPAEAIEKINELYAAVVKGDAQVTVVDTWKQFADANGDAKKAEFPDLLHPNDVGYAMWAAALRPIFATLGFMETVADEFVVEEGFESLFNGKDLTGWGYRKGGNHKKAEVFDGKKTSSENRYRAINGRLVVATPPEGRAFTQLYTTRNFPEDFVLKLEFRATPDADSGVFLRKPQLQCRDYLVAGPYNELKKYKAQDWNEMVVVVVDGVAHCTCNGEVLEEALELPATGPIGLEGDRGQMEYRRIRVKTGK